MDDGTDQSYVIAALLGQLPLGAAVDLTYTELQASNIPGRVDRMAAQIAARQT